MSRFFTKGCEFRAAIFDMDGTLVDSMPHHHKAWMAFLQQQKLSISAEEFEQEYHKGTLIEVMERLFPKIKDEKKTPKHWRSKRGSFSKNICPIFKTHYWSYPLSGKIKSLKYSFGIGHHGRPKQY